jgi:hypothetical protein
MSLWPGLPQYISDRLRACSTLQLLKSDLLSDQSRHVCSQVNVWFVFFVFSGSTKCDEAVTTGESSLHPNGKISDVVNKSFPLPFHHRHRFKLPTLHHPFSIYHTNGGFIKSKACGCDDGTGTSIVYLICQICSGLVETHCVSHHGNQACSRLIPVLSAIVKSCDSNRRNCALRPNSF